MSPELNKADVRILRELGKQIREIAGSPEMVERRRLWTAHNDLQGERPMVITEASGFIRPLIPDSAYRCTEHWAKEIESGFVSTIAAREHVDDDSVVEPCVSYNWKVGLSDYGVRSEKQRGDNNGDLGSYRWDPALADLDADFHKLHPRTCSVDREATMEREALLEEVFDGILEVRPRGMNWWTMGMTWPAIDLVGLEGLMMLMYDNPQGLHRLMAFLRDDHIAVIEWYEKEGLLALNNENDYIGSGSLGYTNDLPQNDRREGDAVRLKDLWVLSESQETVGVSPEMFAEFVFPYQLPVMEKFGLTYYGCCEPIHSRWDTLRRIPNLRKLSVSPWCDQEIMAEALGRDYVFCRKPNPELTSKPSFDEDAIRQDIRNTLDVARDCNLEIVMKDVHTVADDPLRPGRWVQIAREEIARA